MEDFYVDLTQWMHDNDERLAIEKEIFDRAVANGATPEEGREEWAGINTIYNRGFQYFGVCEGDTCFSDSDCGVEVLTIEQVREKYPLPSETQQEYKELQEDVESLKEGLHGCVVVGQNLLKTLKELPEPQINPADFTSSKIDSHYTSHLYKLTEQDIKSGEILIDPYFVCKLWNLRERDDTGALFHILKNLSRDKQGNTIDREIVGIYKSIKRHANLMGVDLEEKA